MRGSSAIGGEGVSVENNFREETRSRAFTYLVLSFVPSDNKREVSRKWSPAAQKRGSARGTLFKKSRSRRYAANWEEWRCFCSTAQCAVNNATTGALAGATGFAAVPAAAKRLWKSVVFQRAVILGSKFPLAPLLGELSRSDRGVFESSLKPFRRAFARHFPFQGQQEGECETIPNTSFRPALFYVIPNECEESQPQIPPSFGRRNDVEEKTSSE